MTKEKLIPQLRFKGFEGEWENRNFFDNINQVIDFRGRTPKKLGMEWSEKGYLALSALNVKAGYIDKSIEAHYGDDALYQKWMGDKKLKKGQVLFTTEAPMGNVARVPDNEGYILSQRTISFELKSNKMKDIFLSQLLRSNKVYNRLTLLSSGATAKGVSQKTLKQLYVSAPKNLVEQQKIGSFFEKLDKLIELYQKNMNLKKEQKQSLFKKVLPRDGQPFLRFDGFSEKFNKVSLSYAINKELKGKAQAKLPEGGSVYLDTDYLNGGNKRYIDSPKNVDCSDVLILWDGSQAGTVYHGYSGALGSTLKAYNPKESGAYLYQYLKGNQKEIYHSYRSPNIPHVIKTFTEEFKIMIPSLPEQQKIGQLFQKLDQEINLYEQKIEHLKQLKKGYLQKLFC